MINVRVHVDTGGLDLLAESVARGLRSASPTGGAVHFRRMLKRWGVRYLEFTRRRYFRLARSGGGGEWPPLSPVTIARRRQGRAGSSRLRDPSTGKMVEGVGTAAILIDTASLIAALNIGAPGSLFKETAAGTLRVGFAPVQHTGDESGPITFAEIARIHQFGSGRIPARPILVAPDVATLAGMASDAKRAVSDAIRVAAAKARRGAGNG